MEYPRTDDKKSEPDQRRVSDHVIVVDEVVRIMIGSSDIKQKRVASSFLCRFITNEPELGEEADILWPI